jgi:hypothetical protein
MVRSCLGRGYEDQVSGSLADAATKCDESAAVLFFQEALAITRKNTMLRQQCAYTAG